MPRLSLCLIVRNAERDLARCLASAREVVDEIVVVDTGSTDNTRAIAQSYADHFAEYPWHDHFADARNVSLSLATGDWILVLDADEELDPATRALIRPALEQSSIAAYQLLLQSLTSPSTRPVSQFQFRLFRNRTSIRYTSPIHEQIVETLVAYLEQTGQQTARLPAIIVHHGYLEGYNLERGERNRRILRKALVKSPDDPYYLYKLARELKEKEPEEAKRLHTRAAEILMSYADRQLERCAFATEVLANEIQDRSAALGDQQALELCTEVIRRVEPHPLLHYLRGALHWRLGAVRSAQHDLEASLELEEASGSFYYDAPEIRWRSNTLLGELYFQEGFYNRAQACFTEALRLTPGHTSAIAYLLRIQALQGDPTGALKRCIAWVQQSGEPEASFLCAEMLLALNRPDTTRRWLARLREDYQNRPDLLARVQQLQSMAEEDASS